MYTGWISTSEILFFDNFSPIFANKFIQMKDFFRDVFEYHHHFNQRLANQLIPHQEILPNRTIPLFSHIINAHQIWNSRILNQQKLGVHEVHSLEKCKRLDTDNRIHTEQIIATMD